MRFEAHASPPITPTTVIQYSEAKGDGFPTQSRQFIFQSDHPYPAEQTSFANTQGKLQVRLSPAVRAGTSSSPPAGPEPEETPRTTTSGGPGTASPPPTPPCRSPQSRAPPPPPRTSPAEAQVPLVEENELPLPPASAR